MANAARVIAETRAFIEESLVLFQLCDLIWDERPAATRIADACPRAADAFVAFMERIGLMRFRIDFLLLNNYEDPVLNLLQNELNFLLVLYSRRVLEWNDEFRRRHYQNEHQFDIVGDFLPAQRLDIEHFLVYYHAQTGAYFGIGARDQTALTRLVGQNRSQELAPLQWPALTPRQRMHYVYAGEPVVLTRERRIADINDMILREHRRATNDYYAMYLPDVEVQLRYLREGLARARAPPALAPAPRISRFQNMNRQGSDPFDCPACLEPQVPAEGAEYYRTDCGHRFCLNCIRNWVEVQRHPSCPLCRRNI